MQPEILRIISATENTSGLPSRSTLQAVAQSADLLRRGVGGVLRGKLLKRVAAKLQERNLPLQYLLHPLSEENLTVLDEFDPRLAEEGDLISEVTPEVYVSLGVESAGENPSVWTGLKKGSENPRNSLRTIAREIMSVYSGALEEENQYWFGWHLWTNVTYENCLDELTIEKLAERLISMHEGLRKKLEVAVI